MGHHWRLATNRHCCLAQHCRFEPWTDNVVFLNIAGLSHEPTVLSCSTLPVWAIDWQCWLAQYCRFEPWTDSIGLLNTVGLSQEPTLLKQTSLSVGTTNRQCYLTCHYRVDPGTDTVACRSVSIFKNRQWCQPLITVGMPLSVQNPAVKGGFWTDSDFHICCSDHCGRHCSYTTVPGNQFSVAVPLRKPPLETYPFLDAV